MYAQNYGAGVIIGSPTGFTGKYFWSQNSAIVVHAGWSFLDEMGLHITGDYQFLFSGVIRDEDGIPLKSVVPYLGVGGRFRFKKNEQEDKTELILDPLLDEEDGIKDPPLDKEDGAEDPFLDLGIT